MPLRISVGFIGCQACAIAERLTAPGLQLLDPHPQSCPLEKRSELSKGFDGGQGDHHHSTRGQLGHHGFEQLTPLSTTASQQHPIRG